MRNWQTPWRSLADLVDKLRGDQHWEVAVQALIAAGNHEQAQAKLLRGLTLFPASDRLHLLRAEQLMASNECEQGRLHLDIVARKRDTEPEARMRCAELFERLGMFSQAESVYSELVGDSELSVSSAAHFNLGRLNLETDRTKALFHLTKAVCVAHHDAAFIRLRSTLWKDQDELLKAVKALQEASASNPNSSRIEFVIGCLLTQLKHYDDATRHIQRATWLRTKHDPKLYNKVLNNVAEPEWDQRLDSTPPLAPRYVIIGAMKCGTSSLYNYINQHPECVPAVRKEVRFFNNTELPLSWYQAHFPAAVEPHLMSGEASPGYYSFNIQARVQQLYPDIKIICILRNPVRRAISQYYFTKNTMRPRATGEKMVRNLENFHVLNEMDDDRAEAEIFRRMLVGCDSRIAFGFYYYFLRRWYRYFDKEQILLLRLQDLQESPSQTMQRVFEFLGVQADFQCQFDVVNRGSYQGNTVLPTDLEQRLSNLYEPSLIKLESELGVTAGAV